MLRSISSRLIVLALLLPTAVLATSPSVPASAADGDVLSMEWHTQQSSGGLLSQAAGFTAYGSNSSTTAGGARLSIPNTLKNVTLAPPTGSQFMAGQTYAATPTATATAAKLAFGSGVFSSVACPTSTVATFAGTVTVIAAKYNADGALTELAADYRGTCSLDSGARETVAGSVRHNTTAPWLALKPAYPADTVAVGRQRVKAVTITGTGSGKTIKLGTATVTGGRAADYRVTDNGCAGTTLGNGDSCQVSVMFEPLAISEGGSKIRVALLSMATTGHVSDPVRIRLDSTSTDLPAAPELVTTYPTADGVGVSWDDAWPSAQQYSVERRLDGDAAWSTVFATPYDGPYNYVDHETQVGQKVAYRVTGSNAGWDGASTSTSTTRPMSVPAAGPNSLVSYGSSAAAGPASTMRNGVDGATVTTWSSGLPTIKATAGPTGTGMSAAEVTYRVPVVPGPGEYRSAARMSGWPDFNESSFNCAYAESVLAVRSVAYDETRKPLVFDGSWVGRCPNGTVVRIELRLGVDTDHARITSDPVGVGRLTTYGGRSETRTVTVSNSGPADVTLGGTSLTGNAAGDWLVTDNTCDTAVLHATDTCTVTVRFSSTSDNLRPAVLEVAQHDAAGSLAPVMVPLDGFGATPPAAPSGSARGTVGAVLVWWRPPYDGGLPILSYDVQRRTSGQLAWTTVSTVPAASRPSYVDQTVAGTQGYDYRVRTTNEVGSSAWVPIGYPSTSAGVRAVVVSGSVSETGLRGLFQVDGTQSEAPVISLTRDPQHDYRDPAVSPAGSRLAVSVSVGDGSDGEYDLWSGTLENPKAQQVTSMAGAERDASYSPDASQIAFTHVAASGLRSVWVVPALGGQAQLVRAVAAAPAWTADGKNLVVEDDSAPDAPLLVVDVGSASATPLNGTASGSEPAVSRAGDVAYVDTQDRIMVLAAGATAPIVKITARYGRSPGSLAYTDTGLILYDLTWIDTGKPDWHFTNLLPVAGEPAAVLVDRASPWVSPRGLADYVRGEAHFDVVFGDYDETPQPALRPECRFDGSSWKPCAGPMSLTDLSEGEHLLVLRLTDEVGHTTTNEVRFVSDTMAPTLDMKVPTLRDVLRGTAPFSWTGVDAGSGPGFYDVTIRTATPTTGFTSYHLPKGWSSTDNYDWLETRVAVGQELCVRVRVRDLSGLWSKYVTRCVGRPVDDASLKASTGWRRTKMSGLFEGTETVTSRKAVTLRTGSAVTVRRIGVLATTCTTCGAVKVYVGSRYVGSVSLRAPRTGSQQLLHLPLLAKALRGRVVLVTTSSRLVRVDGLLLRRA